MKTKNVIAMLAAAGAIAASPEVSALYCSTPAQGYFGDAILSNNGQVNLDCFSRADDGTVTEAKAWGRGNEAQKRIAVYLTKGIYAWVGGYDTNGVQINGCYLEDTTEIGEMSLTCSKRVAYIDLYVENN